MMHGQKNNKLTLLCTLVIHYILVCVTVHHIWKWRDVPTWCNNYDLLS